MCAHRVVLGKVKANTQACAHAHTHTHTPTPHAHEHTHTHTHIYTELCSVMKTQSRMLLFFARSLKVPANYERLVNGYVKKYKFVAGRDLLIL